ncbi:RNA polymerase sigma-70 factor (ECF subfamily) [Anseongella ginsenosidimutans]|uniref:RNA polymerase sigma-70 factor (ECF subfamily) n=1 Tax=Anseongella ginsenosidimutans TaxID=496056 RepID=A0A4R3KYG8_9SPHI|nr:RNA polymerase sigma-70 factor [Anseongella ginsenosidimutans]QEC51003.1 RNA polymerase sigma-70 factor [Anseongella ginsenosidimutans]TCS90344.1 RNA polymerase sigma-70 factor (ECF subfamily) [Anseongella ginsenosidimutans]
MKPAPAITKAIFEKLFNLHYEALCRCAFRIVQDKPATEDIVQDVFLSLWNKRDTLQADAGLRSYLYKASINSSLNYLRKQKNSASRNAAFQEEVTAAGLSADQHLHHKETANRIQELINALPPACRTVFVLSRYENMSYREIAASLGISVNTVENHMSKALKFFRKYLISIFLIF